MSNDFVRKTYFFEMEPDCKIFKFPIDGLEISANNLIFSEVKDITGLVVNKLLSSEGSLISDYVTNENNSSYNNYEIHIGQDDRLTFFGGASSKFIVGYFIDCRENSNTLGSKVVLHFHPTLIRKLIIPRGVAHSFDNLEKIIIRNEPIWYSDFYNHEWDIKNDLVSFLRDEKNIPKVKTNKYILPEEGHVSFSKMQQEILRNVMEYSFRYKNNNEHYYNEFDYDKNKYNDIREIINKDTGILNLKFSKNNYVLTGENSYKIVPTTSSCLSDVLEVDFNEMSNLFVFHKIQNTILSILNRESEVLLLEFCDFRISENLREIRSFSFKNDPRLNIKIPAGVGYKIKGYGKFLIRYEIEILADDFSARNDLPEFGKDILFVSDNEVEKIPTFLSPRVVCPGEATRSKYLSLL
ncbi:MAG: hypothetical protein DCC88_03875 [Spirobacillus cienkowskii]|jgi:hypothetical protein|uniref:dTDP-4-dehydrorhamnose 3,5-epimerase n=1 Tax=Spirobacillus cienkowskii TaxID=495820 RepID=A0A369KVD9_9BACT|nr:MAG: hypothetical protein DCC88_03875 [Spirobacillus cienkowskii]